MLAMIITARIDNTHERHFEVLVGGDIDYDAQRKAFMDWMTDIIPTREDAISGRTMVQIYKDVPF